MEDPETVHMIPQPLSQDKIKAPGEFFSETVDMKKGKAVPDEPILRNHRKWKVSLIQRFGHVGPAEKGMVF